MGRLGGRKGAKEGAGIQWPMFPSLCRVVVDKEEEVDFEGEENSRACSVAGLGLGLGWMGGLSLTFFLESEFFVF